RSLTKPTAGTLFSLSVASSLAVIAVISAADMNCAAPAGRSSMVKARARSGGVSGPEAATPGIRMTEQIAAPRTNATRRFPSARFVALLLAGRRNGDLPSLGERDLEPGTSDTNIFVSRAIVKQKITAAGAIRRRHHAFNKDDIRNLTDALPIVRGSENRI